MLQVQILRCVSILASSGQGKEPPAIADSYYEVRQLCFVINGLQDLVRFVSPLFSLQEIFGPLFGLICSLLGPSNMPARRKIGKV